MEPETMKCTDFGTCMGVGRGLGTDPQGILLLPDKLHLLEENIRRQVPSCQNLAPLLRPNCDATTDGSGRIYGYFVGLEVTIKNLQSSFGNKMNLVKRTCIPPDC